MRRLALLAALVFCNPVIAQTGKSPFDAEAKVKAYLEENANDPSKLNFVRISKPLDGKGWKWIDEEMGVVGTIPDKMKLVFVKYRTANALGAIVLVDEVFVLNDSGKVMRRFKPQQLKQPSEKIDDPFTDAFLEQFK